jgi:peptide/nickel transport system substrate-binding protein
MRRRVWLLAALGLGCLALVASASATQSSPKAHKALKAKNGGTLIFGAEQEPPCMNPNLNDCNNTWQAYFTQLVLRSSYVVNPQYQYVPDLITRTRLQLNPERVTYFIKPNAKWNDGQQVTANDYVFTWKTIMNKAWDSKPTGGGIVSRTGYDQIKSAKIFQGGKAVTFTFRPNFADWKDLFGFIMPKHALQGTDYTKDFINDFTNPKNGKAISDGPFVFGKWNKGSDFTLTRNPAWWGPHRPYLDKIVARFLTDSNTEIQQVRGGEVDAIYPQPQLPLAALRGASGLTVQSHLGPIWEHIDVNLTKGNPLLHNLWVRQALMQSINRNQILSTLFSKLNPSLQPLNNLIYLNNNPAYQPHFKQWDYNVAKAKSTLESHGCKKGGDGIYSCGGTRMSFQFESTAGNQLRELAFEVMQQQLKANGIEITNNFKPSNIFFGQDLPNGNFELGMYAWSAPSADPSTGTAIYFCPNNGGTQNYTQFCSAKVDALFKTGNTTLKNAARTAAYNQADTILAANIPTIPLYQKPTFLVYHNYVEGMTDNVLSAGPMWNAENWWLNK